jgi:hypothetical protein
MKVLTYGHLMANIPAQSSAVREFLIDTAVSTILPLAVYRVSRAYLGASEMRALIYATVYPVAKSLFDLTRHKQINPVAILVALGIVTSIGALFLGGGTRVLLIRESLVTAVFGLTCFVSLLLPRPLMFYFGRFFIAGSDPDKIASFNRNWAIAAVRMTHRLITAVWGCALLGEFAIRTWMALHLATATVLLVGPILFNATILVTFLWTMRYAKKVQSTLPPEHSQSYLA